ncbi:Protein of unknown function [Pyronema omphalodes CBS 100304]|uniref:Uncharacterized protein n=1 Tax=Pyronema omphalodes (strain CBS 100304) TaxID=1076935 RepID=U4LCX3_PYROM|nr:Protein of unknown function [Pyronema omphalodes CBS 100304]
MTNNDSHGSGPVVIYENGEGIRNSDPAKYTYAPPTAEEIITMTADELEELVILQLIDRIKNRLAVINAEQAEQKAKESLYPQKQDGIYCGTDNCECPQDRSEGPLATRSGSPVLDGTSKDQDDHEEYGNGRNVTNSQDVDSGDGDILWDWNGGIWY